MSRNKQAADKAAMQASEAGRVLQSQRKTESVEPQSHSETPEKVQTEAPRPAPRNEDRRLAMEEIEKRDLESKGMTPEGENKPPEPPKVEESKPEPNGDGVTAEPVTTEVATPEPPKMVRVKVDGQEFDVPEAEVNEAGGIGPYQREKASENRLKKANELVAETRKQQAALVAHFQKQVPQQPQVTDSQFLASKMDAIRYGTPEEAAAAWREALDRTTPRIDPNAITQQAVTQMLRHSASQEFAKEFSDIVANPLLLKLASTLEEERIKQPVSDWSNFYRSIGNEIRSVVRPSQTATPSTPSTPSQGTSVKEERKASITTLPTAAARAAPPAEEKPQSREDVLNEMKRGRGQQTG